MIGIRLALLLACAQEGGLEVLEGETLYQEGWLFTISNSFQRKTRLYDGNDRIGDPLDRERFDDRATAGVNYGILRNLTLGALIPYVFRSLDSDAGDLEGDGPGDVTLFGKFRLFRYTSERASDNLAVLGGLELPTGSTDESDRGMRLPMTLQPGSGSWDPFLGGALTLERDRWKLNAVALYQRNGQGARGFKFGDEFVFDASVGNRFWIEPYPGPSASATLGLRWKHGWKDRQNGDAVRSSGGDEASARLSFVFHPQPIFDLVVTIEVPFYHRVNGVQLVDDFSLFLAFGYRI